MYKRSTVSHICLFHVGRHTRTQNANPFIAQANRTTLGDQFS